MINFKTLLTLLISFTTSYSFAQVSPQFMPLADSFEVENPNAVQAIDINYDTIDPSRQLFHLFLPDMEGDHPLVVYIHGGGFTGGSPGSVFSNEGVRSDVKYFLDRGFAFASIGYRLIEETLPDAEGVIKCLSDAKRALQFIRYYAADLHLNPEKIALMGTSAGAGTSLWLGTRSEMADQNAADPILRESTRVAAVVVNGSQSTYDLYKWETEVFDNFDGQGTNFTLDSIAAIMTRERVENFYGGIDSIYQIVHDPVLIQYRNDVDMLSHLSADDPPLYINSQSGAVHPSEDVLHHSLHGKQIYTGALAVNISEVKANIPAQSINTTNGESANEFLYRHLDNLASEVAVVLNVASKDQVELYPNPASNNVIINSFDGKILKIEILSSLGKLIDTHTTLQEKVVLDVSWMEEGLYILKLVTESNIQHYRRLVIE